MNIGILIPGFSKDENDWALPFHQNLVRELSKIHDVRVIALRYPHTQEPYSIHSARVYPLGVGAWTKAWGRLRLWKQTAKLIKQLHKEQPFDVLHAMWADETGLLSGWLGKWLKIPSLVTIGGGELVGFPEIGYGLQLSQFSHWIVGQALQHNQAIIAPCHYSDYQIVSAGYEVPSEKLHLIPLGVDSAIFHPTNEPRKPRHLIHVASLIPIKNQKVLLDAIDLLADVTLDIIGEGHLLEELKAQCFDLGIEDRVNFIGKVEHTKLSEYYCQAQINILPSLHEAFGMVTLEAAACSTPTLATAVGFLPDCPDCGTILLKHDEESLARAIEAMLSDKMQLYRWQKASARIVQEKYTIQHVVASYSDLYEHLRHKSD